MYQLGLSDEATAPRLRAEALAIAGIVALQTILGRSRAVHWVGPLERVAEAPKARKAPRKAAARGVKPAMLSGEAFFEARGAACRAAAAEVGANWHLIEGASHWATIPPKMRKFVTARGSVCKAKPDARLPAPRYWAGGVVPEGIVLMPDMPRDRTPASVAVRNGLVRNVDRAERYYRDALRYLNGARRRMREPARFASGSYADRRERYREQIAAAWKLRGELRALREALADMPEIAKVRAAGLSAWVMCEARGYEIHPMLANLEAVYAEQREHDELLAIHCMFDGMARERQAERDRISREIGATSGGLELCR